MMNMKKYGNFFIFRGEPSDIWSCGIVLIAMLTGELPWDEATEYVPRKLIPIFHASFNSFYRHIRIFYCTHLSCFRSSQPFKLWLTKYDWRRHPPWDRLLGVTTSTSCNSI